MEPRDVWAITTYYNPANYQSRRRNFRIFREHLNIPLVAVEVSSHDFELDNSDADILVQLPSHSVLWHKERLLNIALAHVPKHVQHIAWLDCDVIFERTDWPMLLAYELRSKQLVQLFSTMHDIHDSRDIAAAQSDEHCPTGRGISYLHVNDIYEPGDFTPSTTGEMRRGLFGLAWGSRRALLERHGFYDALIVGSGDRAMACAGLGRFESAIATAHLDARRADHYLHWARPFFQEVAGSIGFLDQRLFHLWHGEIPNRRYIERHALFAQFGFNPATDIALDEHQVWRWQPGTDEMHNFLKGYFTSRNEDSGRLAT
jgi:hypothetical protein